MHGVKNIKTDDWPISVTVRVTDPSTGQLGGDKSYLLVVISFS